MQSQFLPVRVMAVTTVVIVGVIDLILTWIVLLVKVSTTLPLWVTKVIAGSNPVLLAYFRSLKPGPWLSINPSA